MREIRDIFYRFFPAFLLVFVLVGHIACLNNKFYFDDFFFLTGDIGLSFQNISGFFLRSADQHYAPIAYIFPFLMFRYFPSQPSWFHVVNMLLFYSNLVVLYYLLKQISGQRKLAAVTVLLFCFHPVSATIVQRITYNCSLLLWMDFMGLSVLFFWRFLDRRENWLFYLSLGFGVLALLTFEMAIVLPFYMAAMALFLKRRSWKEALQDCWPFALLTIAYLALWWYMAGHKGEIRGYGSLMTTGVVGYVCSLAILLFWYLGNLFWSTGFVPIHTYLPTMNWFLLLNGLVLGLLLGAVAFIVIRRKAGLLVFSLMLFSLGFLILPVAMLAHPEIAYVMEPHWFYFSSVGFFMLLAGGLLRLETLFSKKIALVVLAGVLLFFFGYAQFYHVLGRTEKTLDLFWEKTNPENPMPWEGIADAYREEKNYPQAMEYYQRVLKATKFRSQFVYNSMAMIAREQKDFKQAKEYLRLSLKEKPIQPHTHLLMGIVQMEDGDLAAAEKSLINSALIAPAFVDAHVNLSRVFLKEKKYDKAIMATQQALNLSNDKDLQLDLLVKLTALYYRVGENEQGNALLRSLVAMSDPETVFWGLAYYLQEMDFVSLAIPLLEKAIEVYPRERELSLQLGDMLAKSGRAEDAFRVWRNGFEKVPHDQRFLEKMKVLQNSAPKEPEKEKTESKKESKKKGKK